MASSPRDENRNVALLAKSDLTNAAVVLEANPTTKALKVDATESGDTPVTLDGESVNVGDISKGTQTNDVKITMDGEEMSTASATDFEGSPVTVGTTAVEITFSGTTKAIFIQLDHDSTGTLWIGKSNVTNAGANAVVRLEAGEAITVELEDSSNAIYAISDTASQTVHKLALI